MLCWLDAVGAWCCASLMLWKLCGSLMLWELDAVGAWCCASLMLWHLGTVGA